MNRRTSKAVFILVLALAPVLASGSGAGARAETARELMGRAWGGEFSQPGRAELALAEELFTRLLSGDEPRSVAKEFAGLGMAVVAVTGRHSDVVAVMEQSERKRGRGFYLFRRSSAAASGRGVIMAPHAKCDALTGSLVRKMFLAGTFRAGAWNTARRYGPKEGPGLDWDMAHLENTYMTAFTRAVARAWPGGRVIQFHGYSRDKRATSKGMESEIIISSGSDVVTRDVSDLAKCLDKAGVAGVSVFPRDVDELGGTTNVSGRILRRAGLSCFVHFEVSYPVREAMMGDRKFRATIRKCLDD